MSARVSSYRSRKSYGDRNRISVSPLDPETRRLKEAAREKMKKCNDRLVNYVDKVNDLEEANRRLAAENAILRKQGKRQEKDVSEIYDDEIRKLREKVEELTVAEKKLEIERDNLDFELEETKDKLKKEQEERKDIEKEVKDLRQDVDDATIERSSLESKNENLQEALHLERKAHAVELENLRSQIQPERVSVLENEPSSIMPDLTDAIQSVRQQYESFNSKNLESLDTYYKEKVDGLNKQLKSANDDNRGLRQDTAEQKKTISHLESEVETMRGKVDGLERQIADLEEMAAKQNVDHRDEIKRLEDELSKAKHDLGKYLTDYQELATLKMSLDQEIAIYNKVLGQGESKIIDVEVAEPAVAQRGRSRSRSKSPAREKSKSRSRSRSRSSSASSRSASDIVEDMINADKAAKEDD